jgi:hypothetical protein
MGMFNKIKNLFYEEEELQQMASKQPEPKKEPEIKEKEKTQVEKREVNEVVSERDLLKTDPTFKFPVIFEDEDFKEEKKEKKSINVLEEEHNKYRVIDTKTVKEEKRIFKPSQVISPIYGVLDKNYKKNDVVSRDGLCGYSTDGKVDLDSVIKKAYGEVTTIKEVSTREEKFYSKVEEPTEDNKEINLFEEPTKEEPVGTKEENYEEESYDLDEIDKKIKSIDELLKDTNDEDFYSLVDSMYKDEGEDE